MKVSWIYPNRVDDSKGGFLDSVDEIVEPSSLRELGEFACMCHFAPGVFRDNVKRQANLESIELLAFDFDTGKHSSDAVHRQLSSVSHLILASKNHLKDKGDGKGSIERFHVFIPTDKPIHEVDFYKYVSKKFASLSRWNVDNTCLEPARYFYKHSQVLFFEDAEKSIHLDRFRKMQELEESLKENQRMYFASNEQTPAIEKFMQTRYARMLLEELGDGVGRYHKRCQIAGAMKACGLTADEAISVFHSNSGFGGKFNEAQLRKLY